MNRFVLTSIAAAVMAIGTSAIAQSPSTTGTGSSSSMTPSTPATRTDGMTGNTGMTGKTGKTMNNNYSGMRDSQAWERTHRVSKIIGTDVVNSKGEKVGDVEDIVLDAKGNVAYAVVSTGGFLGMGEKMHAVPWAAMRTSTGTDNYMLDVDRERLRSAPGFDQSNWPNVNDAKWSSENRRYFPASGTTRSSTMSNTMSTNTTSSNTTGSNAPNSSMGSNPMNSTQPMSTDQGLRSSTSPNVQNTTPPTGSVGGGQPATGGQSSVGRSTTTPQGTTSPPGSGTRAIDGDTNRGANASTPMPAMTSGAPGGSKPTPDVDNPGTKPTDTGSKIKP